MNDVATNEQQAGATEAAAQQNAVNMAKTIYILYLVGIVIGVTGIVGVVMAYMYRKDAPEWLQSHYSFMIRTFWIGLLYMFVGTVLSFVLIGFLVLLFWLVWLVVRCVKGMQAVDQKQPLANPTSWMFG